MFANIQYLPSQLQCIIQKGKWPAQPTTLIHPSGSSILWASQDEVYEPPVHLCQYIGKYVSSLCNNEALTDCSGYDLLLVGATKAPLSTILRTWTVGQIKDVNLLTSPNPWSAVGAVGVAVANATATATATPTVLVVTDNATDIIHNRMPSAKELVNRFRTKNNELTAELVLLREAATLKEDNLRKEAELASLRLTLTA